jgi:hypothetical protein
MANVGNFLKKAGVWLFKHRSEVILAVESAKEIKETIDEMVDDPNDNVCECKCKCGKCKGPEKETK